MSPNSSEISVTVLWSTREWAMAIAALPTEGALPCRTVLVPHERVAHALRRELVRAGLAHALAGTRFVPAAAAAAAVVQAADIQFTPGEEVLRRARILALFRAGLCLEHFPLQLLTTTPGWDQAFAATITELEATGLHAEALERQSTAQLRDVGAVWQALETSAANSWTVYRTFLEATRVLEADAARWPYPGAVLVATNGHATGAHAAFLRAIPRVTIGLLAARPLRQPYVQRIAALFGDRSAESLQSTPAPRASGSERDLLTSYFLEPAEILADPSRLRSAGPDGSVQLEEHAGIEAEIEAAADWVATQVIDGTPLEEIAILLPTLDPLATMVAERIARLPWPDGPLPVHVAGGLPLTATAAGARALAVVRTLRAHLAADALAELLPALRSVDPERGHLSRGAAMDLLWSFGTVGGNPANPHGVLEWATRVALREPALVMQLERAQAAGDDPEQAGMARNARELERLLRDLRALRPAIESLVDVARLVVDRVPLARLWPALGAFFDAWVLHPGDGPRVDVLLDEHLMGIASDGACGSLDGDEALGLIEDAIASMRLAVGRFGEPAVFVGSVHHAAGLSFRAVRVIGLAEGHIPPLAHEDAVIQDGMRAHLKATGCDGREVAVPTAADRTNAALHALDMAIRTAESRIVLSTPRLDTDRSLREPGSVVLEAAAALGRPNQATGDPAAPIPDTSALRRDAFVPARRASMEFRIGSPIGETAWHDAVAARVVTTPARWRGGCALDLDRAVDLREARAFGALDGVLGPLAVTLPGLTAERPISPSALEVLVHCPHRFLLGTVLRFEEPAAAPPTREIGQPAYGGLFHRAAEEFYRAHGLAFCARQETLGTWQARVEEIGERVFTGFLEQYPLVGNAVIGQQRNRLVQDLRELLAYEWSRPAGSQFVAVERGFGRPVPVAVACGGQSLFLRGRIDRIEIAGDRTIIRDLKTGRAHPRLGRESNPDASLDIQLATYALVARHLATEWGVPTRVSAYYTYVNNGAGERAWGDFEEVLEPAARDWLRLAADLLEARTFPRTPDATDCTYCHLKPVCGDGIQERAAQLLATGGELLARFGALKGAVVTEAED